jgi:hypothetical protein
VPPLPPTRHTCRPPAEPPCFGEEALGILDLCRGPAPRSATSTSRAGVGRAPLTDAQQHGNTPRCSSRCADFAVLG